MTKIKAIIYDLDDTLYDCSGTLVEAARKRAAKAMTQAGLPLTEQEAYNKIIELEKKYGKRVNVFETICEELNVNKKIGEKGLEAYNADVVEDIELFPDVLLTISKLKNIKHIVVTTGKRSRQELKIEKLGIKDKFDYILINDLETGLSKENCFRQMMKKFNLKPHQVIVVGDRIFSEIKVGNQLKLNTVQMLHGRYKDLTPKSDLEEPDYKINNISELMDLIEKIEFKNAIKKLKIVAIGGGTGLPTVLEGLRKHTDNLTAIVTVTDSGRSSGMIRKELNIPPPGDIRNCLIALSNSEKLMNNLFQYRFETGSLEGHSFGNLLIAALAKITGSFENSIEEVAKILRLNGKVLPSTSENTHICAEFEDGAIIEEENNIIDRHNPNVYLRSPIKKVFLKPEAKASEKAIEEIKKADLIILSPGSLFTSVITNLLVKGIPEAIKESNAKKIYVCNIMTQPSQTYKYKASDHIKQINRYLSGILDYIILNSKKPNLDLIEEYEKEHSQLVENDMEELNKLDIKIIQGELLEDAPEKQILWHKKDLLRHDSNKLAKLIINIATNGNGNESNNNGSR